MYVTFMNFIQTYRWKVIDVSKFVPKLIGILTSTILPIASSFDAGIHVVYFHLVLGAKAAQNRVKKYNKFKMVHNQCHVQLGESNMFRLVFVS